MASAGSSARVAGFWLEAIPRPIKVRRSEATSGRELRWSGWPKIGRVAASNSACRPIRFHHPVRSPAISIAPVTNRLPICIKPRSSSVAPTTVMARRDVRRTQTLPRLRQSNAVPRCRQRTGSSPSREIVRAGRRRRCGVSPLGGIVGEAIANRFVEMIARKYSRLFGGHENTVCRCDDFLPAIARIRRRVAHSEPTAVRLIDRCSGGIAVAVVSHGAGHQCGIADENIMRHIQLQSSDRPWTVASERDR